MDVEEEAPLRQFVGSLNTIAKLRRIKGTHTYTLSLFIMLPK